MTLESDALKIKNVNKNGISIYEEIYTKEGIKKIGDLNVYDMVLSYALKKKEFYYKLINKIDEKGTLDLYRVLFRNGQTIDVSKDQPFWIRQTRMISSYKKSCLRNVDLSIWWKRKTPIAKKIPYQIKDIKWLTEDLCYVIGHYLAEGWKGKTGKVCSSGHELPDIIEPILDKYKIPYSKYLNTAGVPCIRLLNSVFKHFIRRLKTNSFDIHLTEDIFHLPKKKLSAIINGFYLGDGHWGNYPDKRGYKSHKQEVYSTSSEKLAGDFQRIGLQLGKSFHIWKQTDHKGTGEKPIYRITHNPKSHFLKDYGYPNISEVSIREFERIGKVHMRDFEVADTNTFVFKNGIIGHSE